MFRIGIGYDIHRLVFGRRLILGGVDIPFEKGLLAHSDGDVLTHAICDALLGGAGLEDIGTNFPNDNDKYKDISSLKLLSAVNKKISRSGYRIENIDSVLIADNPKINKYRAQIIANLSAALKIPLNSIN